MNARYYLSDLKVSLTKKSYLPDQSTGEVELPLNTPDVSVIRHWWKSPLMWIKIMRQSKNDRPFRCWEACIGTYAVYVQRRRAAVMDDHTFQLIVEIDISTIIDICWLLLSVGFDCKVRNILFAMSVDVVSWSVCNDSNDLKAWAIQHGRMMRG